MSGGGAVRAALEALLERDPEAVLVGEAPGFSPATAGLAERFPGRVVALPAVDSTLVGVAVGMAMAGRRVVVELPEAPALLGAAPALAGEAAGLPVVARVPVVPGQPVPWGVLGDLRVAAPASGADVGPLLRHLLAAGGPGVLLEAPERLTDDGGAAGEEGRARTVRAGYHVALLAWGRGVADAEAAAAALARDGVEAEVVDLRLLRPVDAGAVEAAVARCGRVVLVEPAPWLRAAVMEAAFLRLEAPPFEAGADAEEIAERASAALAW